MRIRFTDLAIKNLRPSEKQVTYWHETLPGFGIMVSPGGTKTWTLMLGKARKRHTIGRYANHLWLSYKQALAKGGQVRKGEKGTEIVFTKKLTAKEENEENARRFSMLRTYHIFNVAQVDGLQIPVPQQLVEGTRNATIDALVNETGILVNTGGNQACYVPALDYVVMPHRGQFVSEESYYATLFHELGHATGAKHRLDRDMSGRFGTHKYAAEELVAEICSAFMCASTGVTGELRHAGYIQNWISLLKEDDRAVFTAASKASQAADFLNPVM